MNTISKNLFSALGLNKSTNNLLLKHVDEFIGFSVNKFYIVK